MQAAGGSQGRERGGLQRSPGERCRGRRRQAAPLPGSCGPRGGRDAEADPPRQRKHGGGCGTWHRLPKDACAEDETMSQTSRLFVGAEPCVRVRRSASLSRSTACLLTSWHAVCVFVFFLAEDHASSSFAFVPGQPSSHTSHQYL